MIDHKELAADITNLLTLVHYDQMSVHNANILAVLVNVVREFKDDHRDDEGKLMEFSESAILADKFEKAFFDRDIEETFIQTLLDYERFELVVELKKIW